LGHAENLPAAVANPEPESSMRFIVPLGRFLFVLIFLMTPLTHFSAQGIGYAAHQGVPLAGFLVPLSGVVAFVGAALVLIGFRARLGAWLLVIFLVPVTVVMHDFWAVTDPMMAQFQRAMFFKNVSMLGGALVIAYLGAGPVSVDARRRATPQA
jgi:putative oxidoreductase